MTKKVLGKSFKKLLKKMMRRKVKRETLQAMYSQAKEYEEEVIDALRSAKKKGKGIFEVMYYSDEFCIAERVRSTLIDLGFECTKYETRKGEWINGEGYVYHRVMEVSRG